ncbi:MAG: site-specific integrase [Gammaproteobacteria bacterium]
MLTQEENEILLDSKTNRAALTNQPLSSWVTNPYLKAATSENTRKAYRQDIKHYENWGGRLPSTPEIIVTYLQAFAQSKNSRTLARRIIALRHWHVYQGFPDPTLHPIVKKTMIGITRIHGKPKEKAPPLRPEDLQRIVETLQKDNSLMAIRDNALLQIGFFGGLRRSEIINIQIDHIEWKQEGIEILLPHSKTDQTHDGQYCAIPYGNELLCPVRALKQWVDTAKIITGYIFRRILRNNTITESVLTPLTVNHIVKRCAHKANISYANEISPHSLRRGLATSAAHANTPVHIIMRAGRWKQVNTVMEYIEASQRFSENAAKNILNKFSDNTNV